VGTPFDIIKIRMINDFLKTKYTGMMDCFRKTIKLEGIAGFMKGLNVNILRAIIINAAELSTYD